MKVHVIGLWPALGLAVVVGTGSAAGQTRADTAESHLAAARAAAGTMHPGLFGVICRTEPEAPRAPEPPGPPPRSAWYVEPVKVFDNLYYVGQKTVSAWAITTSAGIILIDTIHSYAVEDEIVGGLRKLNLDPAQIKYAIVSHGHDDHVAGAKYLQDRFGAKVILSAADWDLVESTPMPAKPRRDIVATDGQTLTLGDTTLTMYITPGHTLGTISTVIPVRDRGTPHVAVQWGGGSFPWVGARRARVVTPSRPATWWFDAYSGSARRLRDIVAKAGADVVIGNHPVFDDSETKLAALARRKPGDPHPYVVGAEGVKRYLTVAEECAKAGRLREP